MKTKTFDENDIILTLHDLLEAVEKEKKFQHNLRSLSNSGIARNCSGRTWLM